MIEEVREKFNSIRKGYVPLVVGEIRKIAKKYTGHEAWTVTLSHGQMYNDGEAEILETEMYWEHNNQEEQLRLGYGGWEDWDSEESRYDEIQDRDDIKELDELVEEIFTPNMALMVNLETNEVAWALGWVKPRYAVEEVTKKFNSGETWKV